MKPVTGMDPTILSEGLYKWHRTIERNMPWKETKDPYKIWVSEIILQQTRVDQGTDYYIRFIKAFPKIKDLAEASIENVLIVWQGLGYYSRARNMHHAAKTIIQDYKGQFPSEFKHIIKLKGIGPYTAAAISSFAFNQAYAVLDGNVIRVLSRIFDLDNDYSTTKGIKYFRKKAEQLLDTSNAASYNQAIMDFGALVCTPKTPNCQSCVFSNHCLSFARNTIKLRPFKTKANGVKHRKICYYLIQKDHKIIVQQRTDKDIWRKLYELPRNEEFLSTRTSKQHIKFVKKTLGIQVQMVSETPFEQLIHKLSHQQLQISFIEMELITKDRPNDRLWIDFDEIDQYPFPNPIRQYLLRKKKSNLGKKA